MQRVEPIRVGRALVPALLFFAVLLAVLGCLNPASLFSARLLAPLAVYTPVIAGALLYLRTLSGPIEWDERVIRKANWPRWELAWDAISAVGYQRSGRGGLRFVLSGADGRKRSILQGLYNESADGLALAVIGHTARLWEARVAEAKHVGLTVPSGKENAAAAVVVALLFGLMAGLCALQPKAQPDDRILGSVFAGLALVLLWVGWRFRLAWTRVDANGIEQYTGWRHRAIPWHAVKTLRLGRYQTDKTNVESFTLLGPDGKVVVSSSSPDYLLLLTVAARCCTSADVIDATSTQGDRLWQFMLRRALNPAAPPTTPDPPPARDRRKASCRVAMVLGPLVLLYVAIMSLALLLVPDRDSTPILWSRGVTVQALLYKRCGAGFHYQFSVGGKAYERHLHHRASEGYAVGQHLPVVYDRLAPELNRAKVDLQPRAQGERRRLVLWICQIVGWGLGLPWFVAVIVLGRRRRQVWQAELTRLTPEHQAEATAPPPSVWDEDDA